MNEAINKILVRESCSKDFLYHLEMQIPITENVYRPGSEKYFSLIREARFYYEQGFFDPCESDYECIVEQDTGNFGYYNGEKVPLDFPLLIEAKYKGREVKLGAPGAQRIGGGKARVYVRDPKTGNVKPVTFGSSMATAMGDSDAAKKRRKNFGDRHNCADKKDKTKAGYWSCRLTKLFGKNIPGWW